MAEDDTVVFPMQPIRDTGGGTARSLRFVENRIVSVLLETSPLDMNALACMDFTAQERIQFAQLIGYSLTGFGELSYVDDESYATAVRMSLGESEEQARNAELREQLNQAREAVRAAAVALFGIHPSDLE